MKIINNGRTYLWQFDCTTIKKFKTNKIPSISIGRSDDNASNGINMNVNGGLPDLGLEYCPL
jgi:hypothetical protein